MKKDESPLEKIALIVDRDKQFNIEVFHKAKLLLRIYRDVVWRTQEVLYDTDAEAYDFGGRRIAELADYLSYDFESDIDKEKAEYKLLSIGESKFLVDLVDTALVKLQTYPTLGRLYFDILTKQYIYKVRYTDAELIETLNIERTQYYKRKKEAINLFGIVLWGYIIPPLRDYLSESEMLTYSEL
jgi:hypothetical protein